ncbi:MAG: glycosyltransferase [Saprospiraceae bacterium]|nr:glycosyltransferase [Saprospiraceae bacterium]
MFYPLILKLVAYNKANNQNVYVNNEQKLPYVSFVMSVFNEETVIEKKLISVLQSNYPKHKLQIIIGSDNSIDSTNNILERYVKTNDQVQFFNFEERRGKPSVINDIVGNAIENYQNEEKHIIIISDANVMLQKSTVFELVKHFKNPQIGLVDSNLQNPISNIKNINGISGSETTYISREVHLKNLEGIAWGRTMGPLGGCYALRADLFEPIPPGFLVDDFFIAMNVFEKGGLAINELEAVCFESSPNNISEEFRRKTRISAGNFANLSYFKHLLWPPTSSLSFAFLSHKVLRWYGPFFIIIAYFCLLIMSFTTNSYYSWLYIIYNFCLFGIPLIDWLFNKINFSIDLLRYITYFNAMNLALFNGFFKYLKGVQNGIWEPTRRDV